MKKATKKYFSDIETGRKYIRMLLLAAMLIVAAGYFYAEQGSREQGMSLIGGFACILATVFVNYKYCRCPYCGKVIFTGFSSSDICPKCNRNVTNCNN